MKAVRVHQPGGPEALSADSVGRPEPGQGQSSGAVAPVDPQLLNKLGSLYLTRLTLGDYLRTSEEFQGRVDDLFSWIAGSLNARVDSEFPLEQAADAKPQRTQPTSEPYPSVRQECEAIETKSKVRDPSPRSVSGLRF